MSFDPAHAPVEAASETRNGASDGVSEASANGSADNVPTVVIRRTGGRGAPDEVGNADDGATGPAASHRP